MTLHATSFGLFMASTLIYIGAFIIQVYFWGMTERSFTICQGVTYICSSLSQVVLCIICWDLGKKQKLIQPVDNRKILKQLSMKTMTRKKSGNSNKSPVKITSILKQFSIIVIPKVWMKKRLFTIQLKQEDSLEFQLKVWKKNKRKKSLRIKLRITMSLTGMRTNRRSMASLFFLQIRSIIAKNHCRWRNEVKTET